MAKYSTEKDWIFRAAPSEQSSYPKIERIEAFFSDHAYEPHRHDTYAIGRTLSGVQSFHYKGEKQHSRPGMTMVIHPDEKHDGESGSDYGFRYRMVYIEPAVIQQILQGKPLPFIPQALSADPRLFHATDTFMRHMQQPIAQLEEDDALYDLAMALNEVSSKRPSKIHAYDYRAAERAREYILDHLHLNLSLEDLEQNTGRDRWRLSRDFRLLFGTSPHRYMTMRRLEQVKAGLIAGRSIADAAMLAGFFDQSHMTRHFLQAYGLSPAQWRSISSKP